MHVSGLVALLLSSTLSNVPSKPGAAAPRPASTEIALEVVEQRSGKPSSFGFVVPLAGSVEAWIDRGDDPRRCEVQVGEARDAFVVKLQCDGSPDRALKVEAVRRLAPGKRTRIAEVTHAGGTKRQVFVTLQ